MKLKKGVEVIEEPGVYAARRYKWVLFLFIAAFYLGLPLPIHTRGLGRDPADSIEFGVITWLSVDFPLTSTRESPLLLMHPAGKRSEPVGLYPFALAALCAYVMATVTVLRAYLTPDTLHAVNRRDTGDIRILVAVGITLVCWRLGDYALGQFSTIGLFMGSVISTLLIVRNVRWSASGIVLLSLLWVRHPAYGNDAELKLGIVGWLYVRVDRQPVHFVITWWHLLVGCAVLLLALWCPRGKRRTQWRTPLTG